MNFSNSIQIEPKSWTVDHLHVDCPICGCELYDVEVEKHPLTDPSTNLLVCPECHAVFILLISMNPQVFGGGESNDTDDKGAGFVRFTDAFRDDCYTPLFDGQGIGETVCETHGLAASGTLTGGGHFLSAGCPRCVAEGSTHLYVIRCFLVVSLFALTYDEVKE